MKKYASLLFSSLFFANVGQAQPYTDTLISMEHDTSYAQVSHYSENDITFTLRDVPEIQITRGMSNYRSIGFGNPSMMDYSAPNYWLKDEGIFVSSGIDELFVGNVAHVFWSNNLVLEDMVTRNWGYQIYVGGGPILMPSSEVVRTSSFGQFGMNVLYRYSKPGSRWSYQLAGGVMYRRTIEVYGSSLRPAIPDTWMIRFTPGVFYTFDNGIEMGIETPVGMSFEGQYSIGLMPRIGIRF